MTDSNENNGPVARAKAAIDNDDDVDSLSRISDLQSWCTLSVDTSVYFFGRQHKNPTIVQYAAYKRRPNCLKYILRRCPNVLDTQSDVFLRNAQIALPYPYPLLHIAVLSGSIECVQAVIRFSTLGDKNLEFINRQDNLGFTALHFVAMKNVGPPRSNGDQPPEAPQDDVPEVDDKTRIEIANILLNNDASLLVQNCMSETPLVTALMRCSSLFEMYVDYLIRNNKEDVLRNLLTEKRKEYGYKDNEPRTLIECLEGIPVAYSNLSKLRDRLDSRQMPDVVSPQSPNNIISPNGEASSSIIELKTSVCEKCKTDKELKQCEHCKKFFCLIHSEPHKTVCSAKK